VALVVLTVLIVVVIIALFVALVIADNDFVIIDVEFHMSFWVRNLYLEGMFTEFFTNIMFT
jgi:hypothetical protein